MFSHVFPHTVTVSMDKIIDIPIYCINCHSTALPQPDVIATALTGCERFPAAQLMNLFKKI